MSRETETWVFNIGGSNWEICAEGPTDSSLHPEEYLGQPCHGIRADANSSPDGLEAGDLIIVREIGEGVRGIWRYLDKQHIAGKHQELWSDNTYEWMLYCEALERDLENPYKEDWEPLGDAIDGKPQTAQSHIRGAVANLSLPLKNTYLAQLLTEVDLSEAAGTAIIEALSSLDEPPEIFESPASADPAPYYWVSQTNQIEHIEKEILQAPLRTREPTHDLARLSPGDTVFHYSEGRVIGYSSVSGTPSIIWDAAESDQKKKLKRRVAVEFTQFDQPLEFREVFEVLADDAHRVSNYPVHDSGLNSGYLFNLSQEAGEYLRSKGTEWEPHPLVEAFRDTGGGSVYVCSFNPSDHLIILRRGAVLLWEGKKSVWNDISPGDIVLFHVKYEEDRADGNIEHLPPGIVGGAVVESRSTKRERWGLDETDSLGKPYLVNLTEIHVTADVDCLALDRPAFSLTSPEFEAECEALMDGCLSLSGANEIANSIQEKGLPDRNSISTINNSFETVTEVLEGIIEAMRSRLQHFEPPEDLPGMLPFPDEDLNIPASLHRRLGDVGQLLFYGPPGTGKTFTATHLARKWVYERSDTPADNQVQTVTFHPSVSYEDFVEGLTATKAPDSDAVTYEYDPGTFKRIYEDARTAYERANGEEPPRYVLIIDEINRGNVPQILGELITLLESEKRMGASQETSVQAAHSGEELTLPPNFYIIGTMNTADQSIALIDAAIRRRFSFHAFPPKADVIVEYSSLLDPTDDLDALMKASTITPKSLLARSIKTLELLNERIVDGDPGRGQRLGHTYLMGVHNIMDLCDAWQFDILPLLEEYYFGNVDRLRADLLTNEDEGDLVADHLFDADTGEVNPDLNPNNLYVALGELLDIDTENEPELTTEE